MRLAAEMVMQTARVPRGKVKDERTIELDEPVGDVEAEVEVIVRPIEAERNVPLYEVLGAEEWIVQFHTWLDAHDPDLPVLPAEALRREGIYEDRA
jgi:hypothetical protein